MSGPTLPISVSLHAAKYRSEGETFEEGMTRIANALKDDQPHFSAFRDILMDMRFMPGGRVQAAMGAPKAVTPYNCFVSGTIDDAFTDGTASIMARATEAAQTMRLGGGIGYDFCLAPGTLITTLHKGCIPVEQLVPGDELIGFPESFNLQTSSFEKSIVEVNKQLRRECYLIETDQGNITASADHLFVARTKNIPKKIGEGMRWIRAAEIAPGNLIGFTIRPWSNVDLTDSWLAGMFDGEGWATNTNVGIAQNFGPVADRIRSELNKLEVSFREHKAGDNLCSFVVKGKWEAFRLTSMLNTTRINWSVIGRKLCGKSSKPARVLKVTPLGEQTVWATQTTTRTLIANGFLSHNSTLRPRGDLIKKLGSQSSGPVSFMHIYDAICKCVASSGHRRGAQMGVLRVDHPDIREFINAKKDSSSLTGFNISVGVTDEFMHCLDKGKPFALKFGGNVYGEIDPVELWDEIMTATWDWAEPGVLFIDQINRMNNLWYCEDITATNPCGEQPLPPHGACLLGSLNLVKYVTKSMRFDTDQLVRDIPHIIRAMDNIVDRAEYPLPQQGREARAKRRMGIGVTGMANAIEAMGHPYGSDKFRAMEEKILNAINEEAYSASVELAMEKGSFAKFVKEHYLDGAFTKTLAPELRKAIRKHGIRNSHLTSIAPTGTISLCADNVSSGIEPVFSYAYDRTIQTFDGPVVETVTDYGVREFGVEGKRAQDVTVDEHVGVLLSAQKYVDSAVSKTCNVGDNVTFEEFKDVYRRAWAGGAKGITTFRAAGKRFGILVAKEPEAEMFEEGASCQIDLETGRRSCE